MQADRRSFLKYFLFYALFLLAAAQGRGQTRSITYQWLNLPCAENINCATGCSACNEPVEEDMVVFGTAPALVGVTACPHPVVTGDNALFLSGWSTAPDDAHRILISGIAQVPVHIDSLIITHRSDVNGPTRVFMSIKDLSDGEGLEADVSTDESFTTTVLTDCGDVNKPVGSSFATFQLQLQAYLGGGGDWILDEVRIVVSPLEELLTTATTELVRPVSIARQSMTIDILGRERQSRLASGLHYRTTNTIIIP